MRQHTILESDQKHGVPFEHLGGMDRRQHDRIFGRIVQRARLIGDLALELEERLTGLRELDNGINDRTPLRLLPARRPARPRVASNVAQMSCTYFEIAANSGR